MVITPDSTQFEKIRTLIIHKISHNLVNFRLKELPVTIKSQNVITLHRGSMDQSFDKSLTVAKILCVSQNLYLKIVIIKNNKEVYDGKITKIPKELQKELNLHFYKYFNMNTFN